MAINEVVVGFDQLPMAFFKDGYFYLHKDFIKKYSSPEEVKKQVCSCIMILGDCLTEEWGTELKYDAENIWAKDYRTEICMSVTYEQRTVREHLIKTLEMLCPEVFFPREVHVGSIRIEAEATNTRVVQSFSGRVAPWDKT
jgi:hypothetical protein